LTNGLIYDIIYIEKRKENIKMKKNNITIEEIARITKIPLEKLVKLPTKRVEELYEFYAAKERAIGSYEAFLILNGLY
jgi:hypothetical protein